MATAAKPAGAMVMEASLTEFGALIRKLKQDVTNLVQGDSGSFSTVVMDISDVIGGVNEFILGLSIPPTVGDPAKLAECKAECKADLDSLMAMVAAERPRFMEAGAGGSLTEGARLDNLLKLLEKLAPLIMLFL